MTTISINTINKPNVQLLILSLLVVVLFIIFKDSLIVMESFWAGEEAYSYGYLIPVIVAYFIWQRRDELHFRQFSGSWVGVFVVLTGLFTFFLGTMSTTMLLNQYAFVVTLIGIFLAIMGWKYFKIIAVPLSILFFMIPLPQFLYNNLSGKLQLISSEIGVAVIRGFGISVHLQGNVIDLGSYQLQVVEACSGLNYLFPLMSFGFICAYLFKAPLWQRSIVFLSSIPLTVFMNSFRIGVIGVLVEHWGNEMAEGFLHDFEGWIVFMACVGLMLLEIWLLTKITRRDKSFLDVFGLEKPVASREGVNPAVAGKTFFNHMIAVTLLVSFSLGLSTSLQGRESFIPERVAFANFPLKLNDWIGVQEKMEKLYYDALKLDDYALNNYRSASGEHVNFYSAYYDSQQNGATIHSPRSCIPGGGWEIQSHEVVTLSDVLVNGVPLEVNRIEIQKGKTKQLVYYWFQQRGRVITNEYLVKWYLFWDSLMKNRTDGALVRLVTQTNSDEPIQSAEKRLTDFAAEVSHQLGSFIPG